MPYGKIATMPHSTRMAEIWVYIDTPASSTTYMENSLTRMASVLLVMRSRRQNLSTIYQTKFATTCHHIYMMK